MPRRALPWVLLTGGVVVAGVIVLVVALTGGSDTRGPREVANAAAAALAAHDDARLQELACDADDLVEDLDNRAEITAAKAGAVVDEDDDDVTFALEVEYADGVTRTPRLEIEKESGDWCASEIEAS